MHTIIIQIKEEHLSHMADTNNHLSSIAALSGCTIERIGDSTDMYSAKAADPFCFYNLGKMIGKSIAKIKK